MICEKATGNCDYGKGRKEFFGGFHRIIPCSKHGQPVSEAEREARRKLEEEAGVQK